VIAEQRLGDEHDRGFIGVGSPEPGTGGEQRQRRRNGHGNHGKARGRVWPGDAGAHQDGGDWDQDSLRSEARCERRAQDGGSDRAAPRRFADTGGTEQSSHCQIKEDRKEKVCGEDVPEQQQARIRRHEDDRHEPTGVARRRLGGCCKRQNHHGPRRLLQAHHRPEAASERERHRQERRIAGIAPTRHGRPSGLERAKRRFREGRRVAPDDRDRRPERHGDRHQQRGPRHHGPWRREPDAAQGGGYARCTR
jgi:hypothetical protein